MKGSSPEVWGVEESCEGTGQGCWSVLGSKSMCARGALEVRNFQHVRLCALSAWDASQANQELLTKALQSRKHGCKGGHSTLMYCCALDVR